MVEFFQNYGTYILIGVVVVLVFALMNRRGSQHDHNQTAEAETHGSHNDSTHRHGCC